ncbi:CHAT domain-containing protein [Streptomyces sp. NPDC049906]|uniref:CHAT domain-containing protein n=1 Tax=Streptomyces sp. NPDC049906 TaxID=3155656 RepID=UPI0034296571
MTEHRPPPLPPPPRAAHDASRWERDLLLTRAQRSVEEATARAHWLELGLLCRERLAAEEDPEQADYDRALARAALERALAPGGPALPLRPDGLLTLAELLLSEERGPGPQAVPDRVDVLLAEVEEASAPAGDEEWARHIVRLRTRAAVLRRCREGARPADEAELGRLRAFLAAPEHLAAADPRDLVTLVCFLVDHTAPGGDPGERERTVRRLEGALRDRGVDPSPVHLARLKLAAGLLDRAPHEPTELLAAARCAAGVLDLTTAPDPVLSAHLLRSVARARLLAGGGDTTDAAAAGFRTAATGGTTVSAEPRHWPRSVDLLLGPVPDVTASYRRWQEGADRDPHHLAHAMFLLRYSPDLDPDRTALAGERLDALLAACERTDGADRPTAELAKSVALAHYGAMHTGPLQDAAARAADAARRGLYPDGTQPAGARALAGLQTVLTLLNGCLNGGHDEVAAGLRALAEWADHAEAAPPADREGLPDPALLRSALSLLRPLAPGASPEARTAAIAAVRWEDLGLAADHPVRTALDASVALLTGSPSAASAPMDPATAAELVRTTEGTPPLLRAPLLAAVGTAWLTRAGRPPGDRTALRGAGVLLRAARRASAPGDQNWLLTGALLGFLGCAEAVLGRPRHRRGRLDGAIELLTGTHRETHGPEHPLRAKVGFLLAAALRLRGDAADRAESRRIAGGALRSTAYAVLLQSGTAEAAVEAAGATGSALTVARWCLADGVPAEAVAALDACRGLVLHAATTARTVQGRLSAAGHGALAARWSRALAAGTPPSALRREVLEALSALDGDGADRLLSPPGVPRIAAALGDLGRDALVYLLAAPPGPSAASATGAAVAVLPDGRIVVVPLPGLHEAAEPLRQYLTGRGGAPARAAPGPAGRGLGGFDPVAALDALDAAGRLGPAAPRDLGAGPGSRRRPLAQRLDRVCAWAWDAAVAPVLAALGREAPAGREPRLVLTPMGDLSHVPWHAAWRPGSGGGRRYALEGTQFTYSASARLLCEVAGRPAGPPADAALVVGDPTGDLPYAGREAALVRAAYYPRAVFLGRAGGVPGAGRGTPAEVLDWLRSGAGRGGTLHLACHATVVEGVRHSAALLLDGGTLSAEDLTEAADGALDAGPALVLLAACRSHVSGRGSNEAYTLATAFLTAGARSVVGSLWRVPDAATSLLMFMTHHYLRAEGREPAEALRSAQRWMLAPTRVLPLDAPPELARLVPRIVPDDLSAWAGFLATGR